MADDPDPPGINLRGVPPDPATYVGPLNTFIELHGTAVANNTATVTRRDYDTLHPPAAQAESQPVMAEESNAPEPRPISAGTPIPFDESKYVIDREIKHRVRRPRHPLVNAMIEARDDQPVSPSTNV
jgi:hypothetical protein